MGSLFIPWEPRVVELHRGAEATAERTATVQLRDVPVLEASRGH